MTDQAGLLPAPVPCRPTWTHTNTRAYIYFDIHDAPDIQDGRTNRRRIMRPTQAEVLTTGISVTTVWILGPAVRRDGTLGAIQTRTYSTCPDPRQPDPPWLASLIADHGLTFPRYHPRRRPPKKARR